MHISVCEADFNLDKEYQALLKDCQNAGGIVIFIGRVRDFSDNEDIQALVLSHYSGMTEQVITDICEEAKGKWHLNGLRVIHRVGELKAGDQIVLVAVAAEHREQAFFGAEHIMDQLKTKAPFWKKEVLSQGERWLEMKETDRTRAKRWESKQDES